MSKLILIFSHKLTEKQRLQAKEQLKVTDFVYLPEDLQQLWSDIPSELTKLKEYLEPIKKWLDDVANENDFVLVQGDFGATYILVSLAFTKKLIPVYSTTKRICVENKCKNRNVKLTHLFSHVIFRKFER